MKIGNVTIDGYAALAPMAGVTDRAYRELCIDFGAAYVVSEMVSSKGIVFNNANSLELLEMSEKERPAAVQLFGCESDTMARAAVAALKFSPDIIDINMGCPAPKIANNGCGSALMKNPTLCGEIVKSVSSAVNVPVTVKIRKGWDSNSVNAVEVAQICEENGAAAITIHGRTREQQYAPSADWDIIKEVKRAVKIPVIGNGDINSAEDAARMLEHTGCDMVMIGRGALGNPWIFSQINAYINENRFVTQPSVSERLSVMVRHVRKICEYKGEEHGIKEARKHLTWYLRGFNGAAQLRNKCGYISNLDELYELVKEVYSRYEA
ncbi:MAG: tRNA dihydrouridine synthase DusB [Acutalibacteraceae bacterium]